MTYHDLANTTQQCDGQVEYLYAAAVVGRPDHLLALPLLASCGPIGERRRPSATCILEEVACPTPYLPGRPMHLTPWTGLSTCFADRPTRFPWTAEPSQA
ncbi:hypothetical protein Cci01nite_38710 [Catellatospora citrea]|uniref:Uncharacterized protein n=1 Tax=Catellatospora citrea TaxID=53366 RepID=A0A8J3K972_9ACTN|nr:hypothetical protein Cci01nite_38710 [Catellatospora citrea]